jgi:FtsP/CotA-like multicopper oxidase with cupredoxin domain
MTKNDRPNSGPREHATRRDFLRRASIAAAFSQLLPFDASAQMPMLPEVGALISKAKPGGPPTLNGVIELSGGPSGGQTRRYFQGWDLYDPSSKGVIDVSQFGPGPTLRARVGGRVNLMFMNRVDSLQFPETAPGACDTSGPGYPFDDKFPNCFHGSNSANLHFHGTHTSPSGLGDNVLIEVIPDKTTSQKQWDAMFKKIFDKPQPPASWADLHPEYQEIQMGCTADKLPKAAPGGLVAKAGVELWNKNKDLILGTAAHAGMDHTPASASAASRRDVYGWPQYVVGAFPNTFMMPKGPAPGSPVQAGQAPGTHWYHAHKHGSTSLHMFNGLAGALIVEGDYDDKIRAFFGKQLPADKKFVDRVLVLQQFTVKQNLTVTSGGGPVGDNPNSGNNQKFINGVKGPEVPIAPGEVQLWRFVNAMGGGNKGTLDSTWISALIAKGFSVRQVAMDGVQFSWDNYLTQPMGMNGPMPLTLAGGNRADFLVQAPAATQNVDVFVPNDLGGGGGNQLLFRIAVTGTALPMRLFGVADKASYPVLPAFFANLPKPSLPARTVAFTMSHGPGVTGGGPPKFMIDGMQFEESGDIKYCMQVNSVEDWILTNGNGPAHPFHIHINPFQVLEINGKPIGLASPVWQDVVAIPAGGSVKIRHKFADFKGIYVIHCHILAHEDRGMMKLVRVDDFPGGKAPATCSSEGVSHH